MALDAPVTLFCVTVHEKVVPAIELLKFTVGALPEQSVTAAGVAVATGIKPTFTVSFIEEPTHP